MSSSFAKVAFYLVPGIWKQSIEPRRTSCRPFRSAQWGLGAITKSPVNTGFPFTLPLICINAAHIDHRGTSITKKISSGILANAYDLVAWPTMHRSVKEKRPNV
jgi:hypothetical protein